MTIATIPSALSVPQVARGIRTLHEQGSTFEVRIPDCPPRSGRGRRFTASGCFRDADVAAQAVVQFDELYRPPGIYVTLNPIDPALYSRAADRIEIYAKHTTSDADIIRRRWLLFDLDPVRPSGICASDEERRRACRFAADLEDDLSEHLPGRPLIQCSGNGFYLLHGVDLPNTDESTSLVKRIYAAAIERTKDLAAFHHTNIDTMCSNAARIVRIAGTVNRKGDDTPERPWRVAELYPTEEELSWK